VKRDHEREEPVENDVVSTGDDVAESGRPSLDVEEEGGDAACWVHLVCPECGAVLDGAHSCGSNDAGSEST
jgi:hypothetical protein